MSFKESLSVRTMEELCTSKGSESNKNRRAAIVRRLNEKRKGAGWKPLPKRGDVKKGIAKDAACAFKRCTCTSKDVRVAPVRDE